MTATLVDGLAARIVQIRKRSDTRQENDVEYNGAPASR